MLMGPLMTHSSRILTFVIMLFGLSICQSMAAVTPNSVVTTQTPNRGLVQFTTTPGTYKTLYTAGANGSKCWGMFMTNSDPTTTHLVTIQVFNGGTAYGGTAVTTVLSAGFATGVAPQAITGVGPTGVNNWPGLPLDSDGNPYIALISGDTIQATYASAFTSGVINLYVTCADY